MSKLKILSTKICKIVMGVILFLCTSMVLNTEVYAISNEFVSKNEIEIKNEVKSSRPRYTVEFAKKFIEEYYHGDRQEFLNKYDLQSAVMVNNRLMTMKNLLKRNGINWQNIKNKVTVYNINDLSEEERQAKFAKYLKKNDTLAVVNTIDDSTKELNTKISEINDDCLNDKNKETNKGRNQNWQPRINYENVQELLDFIDECNKNSVSFICDKYHLTQKQLSNRKYLITKSLKERNISFTMIKKSRKDV